MPLPHSLRAFRHRDYRLYFAGQGISQTGTWLQLIATSWLIYNLTGSAFMLGLRTFMLHIPLLVLGPFAGVWVDRQKKRKVLLITQSVAFAQSLAMLAAGRLRATSRSGTWCSPTWCSAWSTPSIRPRASRSWWNSSAAARTCPTPSPSVRR